MQFVEEVLNRGNFDKIKDLIIPNIVWHGQYKKVKGLRSFKKWLSLERSIFPDMQFSIVDNLAEHDKVAIRWVLQAALKKKPSNHQKFQPWASAYFNLKMTKSKKPGLLLMLLILHYKLELWM